MVSHVLNAEERKDAFSAYAGYVTYRISQLSARLNMQASRLLRSDCDLNVVHWRILALVHLTEPVTSAAVVKAITMDAGQFSRNLKVLIGDGLIKSHTDSADNRRQFLTLTSKGRRKYEAAAPIMQSRRDALMKGISKEDQKTFFKVLAQLDQNLATHDASIEEVA